VLPLPLGEGWGEGLAIQSSFVWSSALSPHPGPLPLGEGITGWSAPLCWQLWQSRRYL